MEGSFLILCYVHIVKATDSFGKELVDVLVSNLLDVCLVVNGLDCGNLLLGVEVSAGNPVQKLFLVLALCSLKCLDEKECLFVVNNVCWNTLVSPYTSRISS